MKCVFYNSMLAVCLIMVWIITGEGIFSCAVMMALTPVAWMLKRYCPLDYPRVVRAAAVASVLVGMEFLSLFVFHQQLICPGTNHLLFWLVTAFVAVRKTPIFQEQS